MTSRSDDLTRRALRGFADADLATRIHVRIRAATCPLAALDRLVPPSGRVMDLGCGHGLGTIRMALSEPERSLLGVDVDAAKLSAARRAAVAARVDDRVRFIHVPTTWNPPPGSVDAVVIFDVLYLLPPHQQAAKLAGCAAAVGREGTVVVKEMAPRPRWKWVLTVVQETISVHVARITMGTGVHPTDPDMLQAVLTARGATVHRADVSAGQVHPHMALVAKWEPER